MGHGFRMRERLHAAPEVVEPGEVELEIEVEEEERD